MIGIVANSVDRRVIEELFQLFKTPWEFFRPDRAYEVVVATIETVPDVGARLLLVFCSSETSIDSQYGIKPGRRVQGAVLRSKLGAVPTYGDTLTFDNSAAASCVATEQGSAGVAVARGDQRVVRLGYDLLREVRHLLTVGQPIDRAGYPTIDTHIALLRQWILDAGIGLVEIPPVPAGCSFIACLTHDIDFAGIRQHKFDHTMWGFLYRATLGAVRGLASRRISLSRAIASFRYAAALPFVHLGLARDFWIPFEWYMRVEKDLPATYYMIPFKGRPGQRVPGPHPGRRACAYELADVRDWISKLERTGCEIGVHGIDSWHSVVLGQEELGRIREVSSSDERGIRMHWLLQERTTHRRLEDAGYEYDSTAGYNETVGYRNGTSQVFMPFECRTLLELPMHIQDGALFLPQRLNLSETAAWELCEAFIRHANSSGGALTILWHDRSHAAERFWGDFYVRLVQRLKFLNVWFATASQAVGWFRKRRGATFERDVTGTDDIWLAPVDGAGRCDGPGLTVRVHLPVGAEASVEGGERPSRCMDVPWSGDSSINLDRLARELANGIIPGRSGMGPDDRNHSRI